MSEIELVLAAPFDARKGYKRWGYGVEAEWNGLLGHANIWVNKQGRLFARFKCRNYSLHLEIKSDSGARIKMQQNSEVVDLVSEKLSNWLSNGVDDGDFS